MNPHFFTAPFYFVFIWFRVQGSRGGFAAIIYGAMPKVVFKSPVTSHQLLELPNPFIRTFLKNFPPKNYLTRT